MVISTSSGYQLTANVQCKKGDTIAAFLEKCRQQVSELRTVSVDSMMYIKVGPHARKGD